ncbi:disease resistance-like protein DSC1 [Neltuma alba]|uniref:disease resistance-like protein DSC1 n=1 Tax=Neltuma alba TaxID=207710 RepID=UPI0010A498C6|nr:disease resistance-like protein DSC1 [Prosopis alba]XP_028800139.1 disease resistance-like protein DSC1 [Prosopis alba]XP_028800140.1 disease resistance-like protein DSC1 [Prosopis alba]
MASSSQFSGAKYDVFISFRGSDIRHGFLSHLRKELRQKQIEAHVDDRLEREDKMSPALGRAIRESLISLIIFSKDYASSKRCLDELVQIIECRDNQNQIVIPVFYNTDPSDVRHQKGSYGDALAKHDEYYKEKVPIWRSSLNKTANLSGFHYLSNHADEAELIEDIAKCLSTRLNLMYQSDFTDLVGIHERIADLESLMNQGSEDVRVIGIWGMGGIGKTTIAAVIFNRFCSEFEGHCFLANVREESKNHGIICLKNKMFSKLLKENDLHIGTPNGIPPCVKRRLLRKRVLVVLDDISDSDQLDNLVGALNCFGLGSRIIITTRDKQVLAKNVDKIYEVKPLIRDDAVRLFMLNAFENNDVEMGWIELSRKFISYAKGIPLALKVLGSFLYGKSRQEWESQLEKLSKMPNAKIQDVMRLGYDDLDREEKNIFLYIACFLKGYESQQIIVLLNSCGFSTIIGLRVLRDKALITEVSNSRKSIISMHDLIQEMGREIVGEESIDNPGKRSRLWDANDIYQVLAHNTGTKAIQSITLNVAKIGGLCLIPQVFSKMTELKFLKFSQHDFHEQILHLPQGLESLPNELRFFEWVCYPLPSLPSSFCPKSLVELKMTWSRVVKLWDGVLDFVNLKKIDLSYSTHLLELPDFSMAKNLEEVELSSCKSLRKVHPSILTIHKLVKLNLSYCKSLTILRGDVHLRSLSNLSLSECSRLRQFSVTSENMKNLSLTGTSINELPSSVRLLNKLETLYLDHCKNLKNLPNKFSKLSSLRELRIIGCIQLDASNLHLLLEGSRFLETLLLQDCRNLFELPDNIRFLSSLQHLSLHESDIVKLPASIKHLQQLEKLNLGNCRKLHSVPELPPSIKELYTTNCTSLKRVMISSMAADQLREKIRVGSRFQNCVNLDEHSLRAVAMHSHVNMKRLAYEHLSNLGQGNILGGPIDVIYPGSNVPEWFVNRTRQSSVTVDLSSAPPSSVSLGFIFCVVVSRFPSNDKNFVGCDCYLEINGERDMNMGAWTSINTCEFMSDHVCIWYDERCCLKTSESMEADESNNLKIWFEFFAQTGNTWEKRRDIAVKECGVCPIYDSEYHTFIEELELRPQLGWFDENEDEEEAIHFAQKSNQHMCPPLPTKTNWKTSTQGLKDLINL